MGSRADVADQMAPTGAVRRPTGSVTSGLDCMCTTVCSSKLSALSGQLHW
jgi:hypothetical protein